MAESFTPWIAKDKFLKKILADNATGEIPKTAFNNKICKQLIHERTKIMQNKELDKGLDTLKRLNLLKDPMIKMSSTPGMQKYPWVYNDYHPKACN